MCVCPCASGILTHFPHSCQLPLPWEGEAPAEPRITTGSRSPGASPCENLPQSLYARKKKPPKDTAPRGAAEVRRFRERLDGAALLPCVPCRRHDSAALAT